MRVGTAGWSVPRDSGAVFAGGGQHLSRYARVLDVAEINSSFYRPHRHEVYARWAAQTPPSFRFAVKLPRQITHDARLQRVRAPLQAFLAQCSGLGDRLAVLLVQLPPSLAYEARPVRNFFALLKELCPHVTRVCEPRHASWFTPAADAALARLEVARAAADPAPCPQAAQPGGWVGDCHDGARAVMYHRWHGSPRMYWSRYDEAWLAERAQMLADLPPWIDHWCIFDNTAGGGAVPNALSLQGHMRRWRPASKRRA